MLSCLNHTYICKLDNYYRKLISLLFKMLFKILSESDNFNVLQKNGVYQKSV